MAALIAFVIIVVLCLLAPAYAGWAGVQPFKSTLDAVITIDGQQVPVMEQSTEGLGLGYNPIGPTWKLGNYFLGADNQGRDVMARLLYGGLNSLLIAGAATVMTLTIATILGLVAGYFGGITDIILSRILDVLWAFPVYLLAISLSIVLIAHGLEIGPITIEFGKPVASDLHHRHRLHSLCCAARSRPGPVAARKRIRASGRGARRAEPPHPAARHSA